MDISDDKSYKIQILRGLAIIAVIGIHNTPIGLAQVWCRPFLNFSVGMFLFLSGMLSCADKWNPWKRIKKILIPYLIWTMIYVVMGNYKEPLLIPTTYIKYAITGRAAVIMYYVFVYCELTLLIPLIDKLAKSKYKYLGFAISPIEIIVMRLIPIMAGIEVNKYVGIVMSLSCLGWFSYFYLGYLLGNNYINLKMRAKELLIMLCAGIVLQIAEGYWYYSMGVQNCGTQLKLSSILAGTFFALIAYQFINSNRSYKLKWLYILGNYSFGIYFSHIAVMLVLKKFPHYSEFVVFPVNIAVVAIITLCCVIVGRKLLGKNARYLAL